MLETAFANENDSPGLLLWRVSNAWSAAQRAALAPHGLTHPQFVLLASLSFLHRDAPVMQRDLAHHAGMDPMTTSQVLRALEAKGLVERRKHPSDARARALAVTASGAALANKTVVIVEAVDAEFFAPVDATAARTVLAQLDTAHRRADPASTVGGAGEGTGAQPGQHGTPRSP